MEKNKKKPSLFQKLGLVVDESSPPTEKNEMIESTGFPKKFQNTIPSFESFSEKPSPTINKSNIDFENAFKSSETQKTPEFKTSTPKNSKINPHIPEIEKLYESGFAQMNKEGIDFYEFYLNLTSTGNIDKLELYQMAFNMHQTMNPNFTKESALNDAKSYIQNIEQAFSNMNGKGNEKKESLIRDKKEEQSTLKSEISSIELQINHLRIELENKTKQLNDIDGKYASVLDDVELKLEAHVIVKDNLLEKINKVVQNIQQTIK